MPVGGKPGSFRDDTPRWVCQEFLLDNKPNSRKFGPYAVNSGEFTYDQEFLALPVDSGCSGTQRNWFQKGNGR